MSSSCRRVRRALRLLLLIVLALVAVEFLFGSILDASSLGTYPFAPTYKATQSTIKLRDKSAAWPKIIPSAFIKIAEVKRSNNVTVIPTKFNVKKHNIEAKVIKGSKVLEETLMHNLTGNMTVHDTPAYDGTPVFITKIMDSIKGLANTETDTSLPFCEMPLDLGPIQVNQSEFKLEYVEKKFPEVHWGGTYSPPNCTARHKVAIVVPYRDRQQHLAIFLNHMHLFLMKQQIEYGFFIVEQDGNNDFNRAKLMNVGFAEAQRLKVGGWQCFIFHDIDLLPLDTRNTYSCPRQPRHMSASIDTHDFKLRYPGIFGGVSAMTVEQFTKVNGFSNKYWGWGAEDDDMFCRIRRVNYNLARYKMSIARYIMLLHKDAVPNTERYQLLSRTCAEFQEDGLSTLEYELIQVVQYHLYTHVLVNIDELTKAKDVLPLFSETPILVMTGNDKRNMKSLG